MVINYGWVMCEKEREKECIVTSFLSFYEERYNYISVQATAFGWANLYRLMVPAIIKLRLNFLKAVQQCYNSVSVRDRNTFYSLAF